jgi:rifampicin phosphotransferase
MKNIVAGLVTTIKSKKDYYRIRKETILVARNTHPDLTIAINKIKAMVVEIDSKLCHAAIIAREFNKPILMGIDGATKKFKTGDKVLIDFSNKTIKKLK